ncbi:MAG: glycosyltransferase family 2 protein [Treponema sp.]|nr:glycosyltransferase family 2 protein [Treponema sp.]
MDNPKVSIITPMWKGATLVGATIESVLSQTFKDWEMIIVDDCSPDDGAGCKVVQSYADKDNRIKLIAATVNKGSSGARNEAMRNAKGRYFAFLDSDDIWHPDYLSTMMNYIENCKDESVAIYFSSYRRMNSKCDAELLNPYIFEGKRTYKQLLRHCPIFPSAAIVDTSKLTEKVFFNEKLKALRDDYAYWLEIMKNGLCALGYKDVLVDYRMREDSMTASKTKMIKPQWNIYRKVLKINPITSAWYLFCWGLNGLKKYKLGKK